MKIIVLLLCGYLAVFFTGCSKSDDILNAKIVSIWEPVNFSTSYAMTAINYYNNAVIYPQKRDKDGALVFADLSGKILNEIAIPIGKGPGEIQSHMAITIANGHIVIYDNDQNKLVMYSIEGKHMDDFALNEETGVPMTVTVNENFMFINGKFGNKLTKYDLEKSVAVKKIPYASIHSEVPQDGDLFEGGMLAYDPFDTCLFLGYYKKPFTLEKYDLDLNLLDTFSADTEADYQECAWYNYNGSITQVGDRVIGGIAFDENYIYASYGGGYDKASTQTEVKPFEYRQADVNIRIFDRKTKKQIAVVRCEEMTGIKGFVKILGVSKSNIVIQIADMSEVTYKLMKKTRGQDQVRNFAIVVLENPLYIKSEKV